jgi:hypothetical protein
MGREQMPGEFPPERQGCREGPDPDQSSASVNTARKPAVVRHGGLSSCAVLVCPAGDGAMSPPDACSRAQRAHGRTSACHEPVRVSTPWGLVARASLFDPSHPGPASEVHHQSRNSSLGSNFGITMLMIFIFPIARWRTPGGIMIQVPGLSRMNSSSSCICASGPHSST